MELVISRTSRIYPAGAWENEVFLLQNMSQQFDEFMKTCYKHLETSYPKYYKMDRLSKLCFIGTEILLRDYSRFFHYDRDKIAVILENQHSSIDADEKHLETIRDKSNYFPSPAMFVYTLPNIMIGEICIRHKIIGEGSCFLFADDGKHFMKEYILSLFRNENYQCCIAGSVDYLDEKYEANLYLIEKRELVEQHILKFDSIF